MTQCNHQFLEKEYKIEWPIGNYTFVICGICETRRVIKWKITCK